MKNNPPNIPPPDEHPDICAIHRGDKCNCLWSLPPEALPEPREETTEEMLNRKYLAFFLVCLGEACGKLQEAATEVILSGPWDDNEGPLTYWQKLEAAWTRLDAIYQSLTDHGFPVERFPENVRVEMERLRQRYQTSSGTRSLLHLPIFKIGRGHGDCSC